MNTPREHTNSALEQRALRPELREELHDAWRSSCDEALIAYRIWSEVGHDDKAEAYVAYVAALDREQAAADCLRLNVEASVARAALSGVA